MKTIAIILTSIFACLFCQLRAQIAGIDSVYEFCPAPGQFINTMPICKPTEDYASVLAKVNKSMSKGKQGMVCLGAFGGYVVVGFDHMVESKHGCYDLLVSGNAFYSASVDGRPTGSAEPGSVMVSYDANDNGLPDDEWYELAGSEYNSLNTIHNYEITYYRPAADHVATPDNENTIFIDTTHIRWRDNQGQSGYIVQNGFHKQTYYPNWIKEDSITFRGTKIPNNAQLNEKTGNYALFVYDYGYVDNHPNNEDGAKFNLDWAVDADGNYVDLPGIHFVKVYTALNQQAGQLGETSTEFAGVTDLHITGQDTEDLTGLRCVSTNASFVPDTYYDLFGRKVDNPANGIYIFNGRKVLMRSNK